ncbi:hypothetical protein IC789_03920 [Acinetobacter seifertii]|uniref:Uncharacterized protein n=2 Tax=Acinetobacter TaxID=469 RepID=A0A2M8MKH8_9GAMM|nr:MULTISPECIES: hypothetical protein [Acinetobacter]MBD1230587.1 hypothetical protein [Acinetobacter seifertii]MBJ8505433.1 hypothetical protein [Acinetobacter seifertii]MDQ9038674.1 hypothetical protein [Acinetobacter seifertii]MEB3794176.1 hypothetical protein [Acinetobacter sp. IK24]MEB3813068.1 hypothetical protein [Acinetobacter sp. IK22]
MRQFKSLHVAILALGSLCFSSAYAGSTLVPMSDAELSATRGQALMSMSYIAPTDAASNSSTNGNMGFYRLALDAQLELNANIKKLQLGCGGVNGAGACDIDIDYLSLSGGTVDSTSAERAASSAVITNPFLEFAVKNPNSASTREIQGFRLSAKSLSGLLTFGLQNGDAASGINSLSGYLVTKPTGGTVTTNPYYGITQDETNTAITGRATVLGQGATVPFTSTGYNLNLGVGTGTLSMGQQIITGKRINTANLNATAKVGGLAITGTLNATASVLGIPIPISGNVTGSVDNLDVNVAIKQSLGYFHAAQLNGSAGYLSVQGVNILWPEAASVAQTGWWLELTNPIDIGQITPTGSVDIALSTIVDALGQVSAFLNSPGHAVDCGALATNCLIAGNLPVGTVDLTGKTPASMALTNVVLQKQSFSSNCYGSLKFC